MKQEQIDITALDGAASKITVYTADHAAEAPVLVCMPAMGTAARFYEPLAGPIVREGWRFVTADLRGVGLSAVRVKRGVGFGYREMVGSDWPAVVQKTQSLFPCAPLYLLGHSLGGQLSALYLAENPGAVAGLVLVAAPSVHWRGWDAPLNAGVLAGTQAARAVAELLGYFPGRKLGFGGTEARGVIRDWARQARTGRYEPRGAPIDYEQLLAELDAPVLAFSFEDDFLSPPRAVGNLLAKMRRARVTHVTLAGDGLDHFRWVRNPDALVEKIREWLPSDNV
jgi:predicted alpha/beta hydrolase